MYDPLGNVIGESEDAPDEVTSSGTTQAGSSGFTNGYGIGVRPYNPLSAFSSYTYQLSLYMITPDALDAFNQSGRKDITLFSRETAGGTGGAYLIAQSGGISNPDTRAPGFKYDYYIDNLVINSAVAGGAGGATVNLDLSFTITEAYGFSFISNLKRAKTALEAYSKTINYSGSSNASRQFFILGIKFLGYDAGGNLITNAQIPNIPDPTFQRYYDIVFTEVQFKIDGKTTTYNIKAQSLPVQAALGQKRGVIDKGANQLTGSTVEDIINQLMSKLTQDQESDVKAEKREFPNKYSVRYIGDAEEIAKSSVVSSADLSKIKWPMAMPKDKTTVNDNLSIKAQPNGNERIVAFNRDTPILQAMTNIITQSDYLVNGLTEVYTTAEEPNAKSESPEAQKIDSNKRLKWFNVTPTISNTKFDNILKDWAFEIEYQVRTYEIPIILSAYADKTTPYYGAAKRYEYWWTGQNSEVIKYEQTMNNAYFTVALSGQNASDAATGGNAQVPMTLSKRQPVDRLGKLDLGKEAQNSVATDLSSPADFAEAKIEILGDPDWLANPMPTGTESDKSFYGNDGYTIDVKSGQVFIEIKFLEAVDYEHGQGVMTLNDKILFWDYPVAVVEQLNGAISYTVVALKHMFRGGKFTQELTGKINTFPNVKGPKLSDQAREENQTQEYRDINANENARLLGRTTGLAKDPATGSGTTAGNQTVGSDNTTTSQNTNAKGVANDDADIQVSSSEDYFGGGRGI